MHIYDGDGRTVTLETERESIDYLISRATEILDCKQKTGLWSPPADKYMAGSDVV